MDERETRLSQLRDELLARGCQLGFLEFELDRLMLLGERPEDAEAADELIARRSEVERERAELSAAWAELERQREQLERERIAQLDSQELGRRVIADAEHADRALGAVEHLTGLIASPHDAESRKMVASFRASVRRQRAEVRHAAQGARRRRGRSGLCPQPRRTVPRARGAGRPAGARRLAATRAGPSGDDDAHSAGGDDPHPAAPRERLLAKTRGAATAHAGRHSRARPRHRCGSDEGRPSLGTGRGPWRQLDRRLP